MKFPFKSLYEISLVSELKIVTFSRGRSVESLRITPLIFSWENKELRLKINNILKNITPAITANAAIVTNEGPVNYELTPKKIRYIEPEKGLIVHTNHCIHNDLVVNNIEFEDNIYGQSFERKNRSENILSEIKNVTLDNVKSILSDHDGFPTSICRHLNSDKLTGWQKSVISIIMLPELGQLHISAGNPCENEYEVYLLK